MARVMLVGFPPNETAPWRRPFEKVGVAVETVSSFETAVEKIPADPPSLIIVDRPDRVEGLRTLSAVLSTSAPATPFLVRLPDGKMDLALEAMRCGAYDCLAPPFDRFQVLAAAKRAAASRGRTLFTIKVVKPKRPNGVIALAVLALLALGTVLRRDWNGPPPSSVDLASATLSGLSWDGRSLWVANWYDATITRYVATKGLVPKRRALVSAEIFKLADTQPILVCNTPDGLVTVGFDLRMRIHRRSLGLPTLQNVAMPGTAPSGLAFDGNHVWSADSGTGLLYEHGNDLQVLRTVRSIVPKPSGLAWDDHGFWVIGGTPLRAARLERYGRSWIWRGPFWVKDLVGDGVVPSGLAAGFGRLWAVSGGDPRMTSQSFDRIEESLIGWPKRGARRGA